MVAQIIISLVTSFAGSMIALMIWIHFDLEGIWQQHRIKKGRELENAHRARNGHTPLDHHHET